jgi:hypothetical protein
MNNLSSSRIEEDVTIFSNQSVNTYNATIKRGSILVLGGNLETLKTVLKYRSDGGSATPSVPIPST